MNCSHQKLCLTLREGLESRRMVEKAPPSPGGSHPRCRPMQIVATLLARVYNWFTEGFDTPDVEDAKTLLDELT